MYKSVLDVQMIFLECLQDQAKMEKGALESAYICVHAMLYLVVVGRQLLETMKQNLFVSI